MRAGTEFVAGVIGLSEAVKICLQENSSQKVKELRDIFRTEIEEQFLLNHLPNPIWTVQSAPEDRRVWENVLPGHAHFRVPGADAESVLINLDRYGVDASSGSACSSGSIEPSHVLLAMGLSEKEAKEGLRFTIGKHNTREEMKKSAMFIMQSVKEVLKAKGQL
jgi:cysteine desulfurase